LDNTFHDTVIAIQGYNIYRKDRNASGGGFAVYIQNHIPVKIREDLKLNTVEEIWLQFNLSQLKSIILGSCYRPPSANSKYLDNMCEILDNVCDINREVYFLGDLNIDFHQASCSAQVFGVADLLAAAKPAAGKRPSLINPGLVSSSLHTPGSNPHFFTVYLLPLSFVFVGHCKCCLFS
jgi:hypothetical protein